MHESQELMTLALFELVKDMWPRFPADAWQLTKRRILGRDVPDDQLSDEQLFILHQALLSHKKALESRRAVWAASEVAETGP